MVEKAAVSEIAVVCGAERGVFELSKFGPGGASRCIRSPTQFFILASNMLLKIPRRAKSLLSRVSKIMPPPHNAKFPILIKHSLRPTSH